MTQLWKARQILPTLGLGLRVWGLECLGLQIQGFRLRGWGFGFSFRGSRAQECLAVGLVHLHTEALEASRLLASPRTYPSFAALTLKVRFWYDSDTILLVLPAPI